MNRPIFLIAAAVALAAYAVIPSRGDPAESLRSSSTVIGMRAPEFSLSDLSGSKLDLASYGGKVVLLDFWATWCAPCLAETPHLVDLQKRYSDHGLRIIGISLDDDAKPVRRLYEQFRIDYPVAIGDVGLAERYGGILGLPVSFLIGCDGRMYAKHSGEIAVSLIENELRPLLKQRECTQTNMGN